ncbi:MAG: hypothetical protein WA629_01950 [Candidatus Aquilonibacter sp.]
MITDDELAAIASALAILTEQGEPAIPSAPPSRWKVATRNPDLEIEDYRRV